MKISVRDGSNLGSLQIPQASLVLLNGSERIPLFARREEDVLRLVADGLKNREIAQRLKVKEHSIRNDIYRIFEKLGVSSRVELILYVFSHRDSSS